MLNTMLESLGHYISVFWPLAYIIVFFGMVIEGDIILFTVAFLSRTGTLNPWHMFFIALGGLLFGDLVWYWLGEVLHANSRLYRWVMRLAEPFDQQLAVRPARTLIISKLVYGLGHIMMMRCGSIRMDFRKFLASDIPATLLWFLVVAGLGYLSGSYFEQVKRYFKFTEIALLTGIILLLAIQAVITYFVKKKR